MTALLVCPTYGRLPYLGTMLAGFLNQTYQDKHLVIVNDDKNVTLYCDYPNVTVINCNTRLLIGNKRNLGIASIPCDVVFPTDDDDIILPHRLENHMKQYENIKVNAFRNCLSYYVYGRRFSHDYSGMNDISYRKSRWWEVGGYQCTSNFGEDQEICGKLGVEYVTSVDTMDYVYNFSGSNYHASCHSVPYIEQVAKIQSQAMASSGDFWIYPNYFEYNKYISLVELYKETGYKTGLEVHHMTESKINISQLCSEQ